MSFNPAGIPPRSSSLLPTMKTLMENVQAFVINHSRQCQPSSKMGRPFEPPEYTSRKAALEVCTVAICPSFPEYMIIGTYALVKEDDPTLESSHQTRKGTLSLMTVATPFKPAYPGMLPPFLDTKTFPSAILDTHFHPMDPTLLGVATSSGTIHFFRLVKHASVIDRRIELRLHPLGSVTVAEPDPHGLVHLITHFTWLPDIKKTGKENINDGLILTLAATESSGNVKLVKTSIPGVKNHFDRRLADLHTLSPLEVSSVHLRKHDQEAWTVATFSIPAPGGQHHRILLSGGDDSALKASLINLSLSIPNPPYHLPILESPPIDRWIDRRSHAAGVIAILPLPPLAVATTTTTTSINGELQTAIPFLTGSYDESIRVFTLDPITTKQAFHAELRLGGGVWRLVLMDSYSSSASTPSSVSTTTSSFSPASYAYIVLASCMHGGVRVMRVMYTYPPFPTSTSTTSGWSIIVEASFTAGHESMVYCCDFRRDDDDDNDNNNNYSDNDGEEKAGSGSGSGAGYTIVSTSFYDMRVCVWRWRDGFREAEREGKTGIGLGRRREGSNVSGDGSGSLDGRGKGKVIEMSVSGWVMEEGVWKMR